ncbi:MAG: restriction endonuclease subunit S [Pseudoalteromonas prydzensis]|uniref:restriction endonuclease subunit S n=1 Tax=Pseudoalteromonas prydzensis TaxID=182141 RepID=UPI003F982F90
MTVTKHSTEGRNSVPKWVEVTIGEISDVIAGGTPKAGEPSNFAEPGTAISWLTPADLSGYKEKYISYGRRDLSQQGYDSSSAKLMPKGSLLFSSRAPIGYVVIASNDISTNQGFKNFVFTKSVDSSYAYYYLRSIRELAESLGTGTTFKEISGATAKKLPFLLPPLAEQKVIADKLDTLLAQVETSKARLDRIPQILKTFRQSVLAAAVNGKLTEVDSLGNEEIGSVARVIGGLTKNAKRNSFPLKKPYLRVANVYENILRLDDIQEIGVVEKELQRVSLEPLDLLLVEGNGSIDQIGRVAIWNDEIQECVHQNHLIKVRCNQAIVLPHFLLFYLMSPQGKMEIVDRATSGAGLYTLSISKISSICVPIYKLKEQTEIVRRVEELFASADRIEQKANAALERVNNLTQSILAKAFRGELTADWRAQNPDLISGENSAEALLMKIKAEREALSSKKKPKKKTAARKKA